MACDLVPRRDPFGRAYDIIKHRLSNGAWRPGDQLKVAELAADINLSPTPVREAISRLVGEALIEDRRGLGYFVPRLAPRTLAQLYELQHRLLTGVLRHALAAPPAAEPPGDVAGLFALILDRGGNRVLADLGRQVADRLAPFAPIEPCVLDQIPDEAVILLRGWTRQEADALRRAIGAYHRRRQRAADRLVEARQLA